MEQKLCTVEKQGNLYILTITGYDEHRLNPARIAAIRSSIIQIKSEWLKSKSPAAFITTAHGKFFSNGYDLDWAKSTGDYEKSKQLVDDQLKGLVMELIALPMPTIAAVNGHAAAAGMILAVAHDYVVMRRDRGYMYMSEVDIGMVVPRWFVGVLRSRVVGEVLRRVVMGAEKVTGEKAKEMGIVWEVYDGVEGTVAGAVAVGEMVVKRGWDGGVYCENRRVVLSEVVEVLGGGGGGGGMVAQPRL